ncbi:MAG: TonB family protein, partial [Pyrinomonadaceae bacterium]
ARLRTEEEARRRAEAEARLKEEEARRQTEKAARLAAEQEAVRLATEAQQLTEQARLRTEEEARLRAAAEARLKKEEARRQTEKAARLVAEQEAVRLAAEAEQLTEQARLRTEEEARLRAEAEARLKEEEARRQTEQSARLKAEEESRRLVKEARQLAQEPRMSTGKGASNSLDKDNRFEEKVIWSAKNEKRGQKSSPAVELESTADQLLSDLETKRCPKCNRVYQNPLLAYCSYDAVRLVRDGDPSFSAPIRSNPWAGPTYWTLIMITFLGSGILTYLGLNYSNTQPSAPTVETLQPPTVEQNRPIVGGTLNGKETIIPDPEYSASAKSKGVSGEVRVEVRVNKKGVVVAARALNGHPLLKTAAVQAARKARFSPEKLAGEHSSVSGTITYNFQ